MKNLLSKDNFLLLLITNVFLLLSLFLFLDFAKKPQNFQTKAGSEAQASPPDNFVKVPVLALYYLPAKDLRARAPSCPEAGVYLPAW